MRPKWLFALLASVLTALPVRAQTTAPTAELPRYFRQLEAAYHAGDWTLQCSSDRSCTIIGARNIPLGNGARRVVVLITRQANAGAELVLDLAITDDIGFPEVLDQSGALQLATNAYLLAPAALPISIDGPIALDGLHDEAVYRVPPDQARAVLAAVQDWPHSELRHGGHRLAGMPRGDLAHLLRQMERLQHPRTPPPTAAEEADRMREYHFELVHFTQSAVSPPDEIHLACATQTHATSIDGAQLDSGHTLWITICPEGAYLNMQDQGGTLNAFDLRDRAGEVQLLTWAEFDRAAALLELLRSPHQRWDCGDRLRMGYTAQGNFAIIENRRYTRCRGVPARLWPQFWAPNSWRFVDQPPSNEGSAPPAIEGVEGA